MKNQETQAFKSVLTTKNYVFGTIRDPCQQLPNFMVYPVEDHLQEEETYYYPCPCGDRFAITKEELQCGEEVATCPSCSLIIKVINNYLP